MQKRRWYDQPEYSNIRQSLDFLNKLPDELVTLLAEGVVVIAEREFKADELKALGVEKVLALHKSKRKTRPEDKNRHLHKSMNYLTILSEPNRRILGTHLSNMCVHTADYFKLCKDATVTPSFTDLKEILRAYIHVGNPGSRKVLDLLRKELRSQLKRQKTQFIQISHETPQTEVKVREQ